MQYSIFQIKDIEDCSYSFMPWSFAEKHDFKFTDYSFIYNGVINSNDPDYILEKLFISFNVNRPEDFKGHSLSMSDLVELADEDGSISYYYCDSFGWVNVTSTIRAQAA